MLAHTAPCPSHDRESEREATHTHICQGAQRAADAPLLRVERALCRMAIVFVRRCVSLRDLVSKHSAVPPGKHRPLHHEQCTRSSPVCSSQLVRGRRQASRGVARPALRRRMLCAIFYGVSFNLRWVHKWRNARSMVLSPQNKRQKLDRGVFVCRDECVCAKTRESARRPLSNVISS